MKEFLDSTHVLYKLQYGFRKRRSSTTAIVKLVDNIIKEIDEKKAVGALFIDLIKVFDTFNHDIV